MSVPSLLHYRPWQGTFHAPIHSIWPIAGIALKMMFRRWLFWVIYILGLFLFMLFFFGQYLAAFSETASGGDQNDQTNLRQLIHQFLTFLNGTGEMYRTYFWYQGYIVMIILTLAGSVIIGNDLRFGSLPFYLSKPISSWHYLGGKGLAVALFINLMTTIPAVVLFLEFGILYDWMYFWDQLPLLGGVLGYGLVLTVCLTLLLLATAMSLRGTVPLIMVWVTLFLFCRLLAGALVGNLGLDARWRLIDLWNNLYLVGNACLGMDPSTIRPFGQPTWLEAAFVLGGVCLGCLSYLILRIRAVEIVY
jgi:ABC-2 type transport system permease protein